MAQLNHPNVVIVHDFIGEANHWAIVMEHEHKVYLVRETKGTSNIEALAADERDKVKCGAKHFGALGVDFAVVTSAADLKVRQQA